MAGVALVACSQDAPPTARSLATLGGPGAEPDVCADAMPESPPSLPLPAPTPEAELLRLNTETLQAAYDRQTWFATVAAIANAGAALRDAVTTSPQKLAHASIVRAAISASDASCIAIGPARADQVGDVFLDTRPGPNGTTVRLNVLLGGGIHPLQLPLEGDASRVVPPLGSFRRSCCIDRPGGGPFRDGDSWRTYGGTSSCVAYTYTCNDGQIVGGSATPC
jgi:hypothetical protein